MEGEEEGEGRAGGRGGEQEEKEEEEALTRSEAVALTSKNRRRLSFLLCHKMSVLLVGA